MKFTDKFDNEVIAGEKIETTANSLRFVAEIEQDNDMRAPWDEEDGHGPVSDWTRRSKAPGELILNKDRESYRYYDLAEATKIARKEGWGCGEAQREDESKGAYAARAARHDFERLKAWCEDEWFYVAVVVTAYHGETGIELGRASLCGIESDAGDYLTEVANELLGEAEADAQATLAKLRATGEHSER